MWNKCKFVRRKTTVGDEFVLETTGAFIIDVVNNPINALSCY
jgi:hypothetical protein